MSGRSRLFGCLVLVAALSPGMRAQGQRPLTVDAIYDPGVAGAFSGSAATDITWLDAATYLVARPAAGGGTEWMKIEAASGDATLLFEAARMETALATLPGIDREAARRASRSRDLLFNPAHTAAAVEIDDDLYVYDFAAARATRLTNVAGEEEEALFSPDGRRLAFVRGNNLFVVDLATHAETALSTDGGSQILNGKLDWLYQEEVYGRGKFRSFWWSPDSTKIAFLQLDERPVPEYTVVDDIPYRPALEVTDYPKAGDPNPDVRLGIATVSGGTPLWADTSVYPDHDFLIVNVDWTPDSRSVIHHVQDREQTWLDLDFADASTGKARRILRETTKAWVNENGTPTWLKDGTFLWFSERSGYKHLYHYRADGTLIKQVTTGRWETRTLYGVDESRGLVYFSAVEHSAIGTDIYRIQLDGRGLTRLSKTEGTHRAVFNPAFSQYVDVWSDVTTPTQVRLHRADGSDIRVIDARPVQALAEYRLAKPEFLQVPTRDGATMDAMMIKPPDFVPAGRYPVYQFTYAGPGSAVVVTQWAGSQYLFYQLLAQHGVIVWLLDNRSASGRGVESQWPVYGRLGELELQDLEDGVTWLKTQPYVDTSRMVLSGWSFGGFMTAYALTHSTSWSAGVVGAPVTDWRDYDTIYTERLMKTPAHNPDGYRRTAPRFAAANLHGRMLLIHGTMDDNVHMQNSVQFAYELQRLNKPFEMMVYARSRHSFTDARLIQHRQQLIFDFVMRAVAPAAAASGSR
jgi:dipeptidyl-peptidase-4